VAGEQGLCNAPDHGLATNVQEKFVAGTHPARLTGSQQNGRDSCARRLAFRP
jgi:hypothetical protein